MADEVLVSGCFNVLHAGHVELLEFAAGYGPVTVGINADPYLQDKYGDKAVPLVNRAYCLRANRFVDRVVVFSEADPGSLIYRLQPDYYIKGPDYSGVALPEQEALDTVGTKVVIFRGRKIHNSSSLVHTLEQGSFESLPEGVVDLKDPVPSLGEFFSGPEWDPEI